MRIVSLLASPHGLKGNTAGLLEYVTEGARNAGAKVETTPQQTSLGAIAMLLQASQQSLRGLQRPLRLRVPPAFRSAVERARVRFASLRPRSPRGASAPE